MRPTVLFPLSSRRIQSPAGFTLVELLTVISILAILAAIAAPNFAPLMERWRVRQASEIFQSTLYFARSEAIKRGGAVIESLPSGSCSANGWNCGWQVCVDTNGDEACDNGVPILQRYDAPAKVAITRTGTDTGKIRVDSRGAFGAAFGFSVTPAGKTVSDPSAMNICISPGGSIRVHPSAGATC
ncbi:MAG: GspH/FimT family protein [Comamonadaceae bacterium]|nr:GspH/FimT family protein [Comamonadaceae bacterium]